MNILFTRFPLESAHGGAEVQTISLMKELKKRGHTVWFLGSCPTLLVLCEQMGIPAMELDIGPPPVSKWLVLRFFMQRKKMRKTLAHALEEFRTRGADAVCMLSLSEKILLTPYAVNANMKVLWIEHDSIGRWLSMNPFLSTLRTLSTYVTTVVVSQLSRQKYVALGWGATRVATIPNGVDPKRFAGKIGKKNNGFHIGTVARLSREKGIDLLIRSMEGISDAELTIIGVGKEEENLTELIEDKALAGRVHIVPRMGNLGDFYRALDVFVLPSRSHDPFGLVAAEAMCSGVPVIVTDACGIATELKHGRDALVVPAESVFDLRKAILKLQQNDEKRKHIGNAGKKHALTAFTIESMVDRYEHLLLH